MEDGDESAVGCYLVGATNQGARSLEEVVSVCGYWRRCGSLADDFGVPVNRKNPVGRCTRLYRDRRGAEGEPFLWKRQVARLV
jgi:hypothetical protein